ncbi:MAG: hypothetical protein RMJ97_05585 [Raineya sp.]|nr:hypothetical protein [Raineya sp.]MDW8296342.1 hypothetical protein [Raineya sp.]
MVFILIVLAVFAVQYFLHWEVWTIAVISFIVGGILGKTAWGSFFSAFLAVFIVWSGGAFWLDIQNDQILSARMAAMFGIPAISEWFFVVTGLIGGILASFSCLAGYYVKRIFIQPPPKTPITGR